MAEKVTNVMLEDGSSLPSGSRIEGQVVAVKKPSSSDFSSFVTLKFNRLQTKNGSRNIHATLIAVAWLTPPKSSPPQQANANDISTRATMLGINSASPMRSPQTAAEDANQMPDTKPQITPAATAVLAHSGSVIGLPGVRLLIGNEGSELSSESNLKLSRGLQLMLKVAK